MAVADILSGATNMTPLPLLSVSACPAHFFTVAAALRAGVGCEHAGYGCAVESDKLAYLAVGIVFFGSASVVGELREVVGHFHGVAEAGSTAAGLLDEMTALSSTDPSG